MNYYYTIDGRRFGPFSLDEMKAKRKNQEIGSDTLVWKDGLIDWVKADELSELSGTAGEPKSQVQDYTTSAKQKNHASEYTDVLDNTKMFSNCLRFKGRARRTEYWIICVLASIYSSIWESVLENSDSSSSLLTIFIITWLFMLWPIFSVRTRRCHDLGHNAFWQFIPFYGIFLALAPGESKTNKYGSPTNKHSER